MKLEIDFDFIKIQLGEVFRLRRRIYDIKRSLKTSLSTSKLIFFAPLGDGVNEENQLE
jgi:hypothetical protein